MLNQQASQLILTRLLPIPEFAKRVGLRPEHARDLVRRGDIPSVPVGGRRRVSEKWIERWLAQGEPGEAPQKGRV